MAEMASVETSNGFPKIGRGTRPKCVKMLTEAKELQELLAKEARSEDLKPLERSSLIRVWHELGAFRLRLQGKGPPKAVDYASKKPKTKASQGFTETPVEKGKGKTPKTDTTTDSGPT